MLFRSQLNIAFIGAQIAPGFFSIVAEVTKDIAAILGGNFGPVGCGDADAIVNALADFVEVHQNLLSIVIGKVSCRSALLLRRGRLTLSHAARDPQRAPHLHPSHQLGLGSNRGSR